MPRRKPGAEPKPLGRRPNPNKTPKRRATFTLDAALLDRLRAYALTHNEPQAAIVTRGIETEIGK